MDGLLTAFALVFLAEMGDKTQLIVMAFAARYSWRPVMAAVVAATLVNHGIAAVLGAALGSMFPAGAMRVLGSLAFIGFGLWTLFGREDDEEGGTREGRSAFWTVALTFFIGEMGDKTQLSVLAVAAESQEWAPVLAGSVSAMAAADGFAILAGSALRRRVPPDRMKRLSAFVFMACGVAGLFSCVLG